jgi:hypothetical protein
MYYRKQDQLTVNMPPFINYEAFFGWHPDNLANINRKRVFRGWRVDCSGGAERIRLIKFVVE